MVSTPRAWAKWFSVPPGTTSSGILWAAATSAAAFTVPSPPATPRAHGPVGRLLEGGEEVVAGAGVDLDDLGLRQLGPQLVGHLVGAAGGGVDHHDQARRPRGTAPRARA